VPVQQEIHRAVEAVAAARLQVLVAKGELLGGQ
jgi:hypothetical protein